MKIHQFKLECLHGLSLSADSPSQSGAHLYHPLFTAYDLVYKLEDFV